MSTALAQTPLYNAFMAQVDQKLQQNFDALQRMLQPLCAAMNQKSVGIAAANAMPGAANDCGCGPNACNFPGTSSVPGGPVPNGNPFTCIPIPTSMNSWCPVKCDPCLFGNLALDMELFAWPLIESQLWDTDTKLTVIRAGGPFPLVAGASITMEQEARRTLQYVPDCVQISTTWDGGPPQPGLLTYQWQVAQRSAPAAPVQFSNPQTGQQYECGDNCIKVPFPSYKGCSGFPIGSEAVLQLLVTASAAMTSELTSISIVVYHRKKEPGGCGKNGCDLRNGSCKTC